MTQNLPQTQTGNFNIPVTFSEPVENFTIANIDSIASLSFTISGSGNNYNIGVEVPDNANLNFQLKLMGSVTVNVGSQKKPLPILSLPIDVSINTLNIGGGSGSDDSRVTAKFFKPEYEDDRIRISIQFDKDVLFFSKTDCELTRVYGDYIYDFEYYLLGTRVSEASSADPVDPEAATEYKGGMIFELVVIVPPDRQGAFTVDITGDVFIGNLLEGNTATLDPTNTTGAVDIIPVFVPYDSESADSEIVLDAYLTDDSELRKSQV